MGDVVDFPGVFRLGEDDFSLVFRNVTDTSGEEGEIELNLPDKWQKSGDNLPMEVILCGLLIKALNEPVLLSELVTLAEENLLDDTVAD